MATYTYTHINNSRLIVGWNRGDPVLAQEETVDITTIPALPGYSIISIGIDDAGKPWTFKDPIIAWHIERHNRNYDPNKNSWDIRTTTTPVSIYIDNFGSNGYEGILYPDGRICVPWDRMYNNEAEYISISMAEKMTADVV